MYNLIQYGTNYRETTGTLWNYCRDQPNKPPADNYNADPMTHFASFKYKSSITGKTLNNDNDNNENDNRKKHKEVKIVVPLKHLRNFWRTLDIPLINCEVNLISLWSKKCILIDKTMQAAVSALRNDLARPAMNVPTDATFKITETNYMYQLLLYQPKMIINYRQIIEFKRTIKSNKCRSEMSNQTKITI